MNTLRKFKVSWVTIWLIAAAVAFSGIVGYAAYTRVTTVKRVVSTRAGAGVLFSSNYMSNGAKPQVSIEYGDYSEYTDIDGNPIADNPVYNMTVCNYSQGDKATWYVANDIKYQITAKLWLNEKYTASELPDGDERVGTYKPPTSTDLGSLKFGIKYEDDSDYTYFTSENLTIDFPVSGSYTLSKLEASSDMFSILFDKSELLNNVPGFWIEIIAVPVSVSGGEVETIRGYIATCKSAADGARWTGYIEDEDYDTTDYDSYNYIVSGNGKGTFYFAWNDDEVKPNEFAFLNYSGDIITQTTDVISWADYEQYGKTNPISGTWKYIELKVNSDSLARYEFQLYKTSGEDYKDVISKYVDYYFVAE